MLPREHEKYDVGISSQIDFPDRVNRVSGSLTFGSGTIIGSSEVVRIWLWNTHKQRYCVCNIRERIKRTREMEKKKRKILVENRLIL